MQTEVTREFQSKIFHHIPEFNIYRHIQKYGRYIAFTHAPIISEMDVCD